MTRKTIITIEHLDNNQISATLNGNVSMNNIVIAMAKLIEQIASGKVNIQRANAIDNLKIEGFDERLKK